MSTIPVSNTQGEATMFDLRTSFFRDIGRRFSDVRRIAVFVSHNHIDATDEATDSSQVDQSKLHVIGLEPSESTQRALEQLERDDMPTFEDSAALFAYLKG